jgi:hypothetical protein
MSTASQHTMSFARSDDHRNASAVMAARSVAFVSISEKRMCG